VAAERGAKIMTTAEMAAPSRPGVLDIAGRALRSMSDGVSLMPLLVVSASLGVGLIDVAVPFARTPLVAAANAYGPLANAGADAAVEIAASFLRSLFFAPVAVAMHRFVLLGALTRGPIWPAARHTQAFIGWLLLVSAVQAIIAVPLGLLVALRAPSWEILALDIPILLLSALIVFRISLLFPAVAVDVPSDSLLARLRSSWEQTRGNFWYVFFACFLAGLAVAIPAAMLSGVITMVTWMLIETPRAGSPLWQVAEAPSTFIQAASLVIVTMAEAAALSWLYRVLVGSPTRA
jgi:hypothetical protein